MDNLESNMHENFLSSSYELKSSTESNPNPTFSEFQYNLEDIDQNKRNKKETVNDKINKSSANQRIRKFNFKPENLNIEKIMNGKIYICSHDGCCKKYTNRSRLTIHKRTHTGIKLFECTVCQKTFNEKGNLNIHMRIHTGEKPYKCQYNGCYKMFKAYGHLRDHLMRHYNIRPFKCLQCDASFSRKNTLKTHEFVHSGEKPFSCPELGCPKRFTEKGNMKTHYQTHLRKKQIFKKKFSIYNKNFQNSFSTIENCNNFFILGEKLSKFESCMESKKTKSSIETNSLIHIRNFRANDLVKYSNALDSFERIDYFDLSQDNCYSIFNQELEN